MCFKYRHRINLVFISSPPKCFHGFTPVDKILAVTDGRHTDSVFPYAGNQHIALLFFIPEWKIMTVCLWIILRPGNQFSPVDSILRETDRHMRSMSRNIHFGHHFKSTSGILIPLIRHNPCSMRISEQKIIFFASTPVYKTQ